MVDVLLTGWEEWDTGNYEIPGKNVRLKDGTKGCVLVSIEGASIYSLPIETVGERDMGSVLVDSIDFENGVDALHAHLTDKDVKEVETVFKKYQEYQDSYEA